MPDSLPKVPDSLPEAPESSPKAPDSSQAVVAGCASQHGGNEASLATAERDPNSSDCSSESSGCSTRTTTPSQAAVMPGGASQHGGNEASLAKAEREPNAPTTTRDAYDNTRSDARATAQPHNHRVATTSKSVVAISEFRNNIFSDARATAEAHKQRIPMAPKRLVPMVEKSTRTQPEPHRARVTQPKAHGARPFAVLRCKRLSRRPFIVRREPSEPASPTCGRCTYSHE